MPTTVHLMYGLSGSGKTTLARRLAEELPAVRFTLDEWMLQLFPGLDFASTEYGRQAESVRPLMWSVAVQVLASGTDVVLDWNSWSRVRRAWAVERARAVGADVVLHQLGIGLDEASRRAAERTGKREPWAHPVTREGNVQLAGLMEPPSPDEGFRITRH